MKINDRGQAVWDQKEYLAGLRDAAEFEAQESVRVERPNRSWGPGDSARYEAKQEAEHARREWESDMAWEKTGQ